MFTFIARSNILKSSFRNAVFHQSRTFQQRYTNSQAQTVKRGAFDTTGIFIFSSICLGTFGLGVWQIKRYKGKVDLISTANDISLQDAVALPPSQTERQLMEDLAHHTGHRFILTGHFDHSKEIRLGPRSAPASLSGSAQGLAVNPQGYFIITPFITLDGAVVFINRGWAPLRMNADRNLVNRPTATVTLTCQYSGEEKSGYFAPVNDIKAGTLLWVERKALLQQLGRSDLTEDDIAIFEALEDRSTVVKAPSAVLGFPYARDVKEAGAADYQIAPITHLVYALTWFSLSAAGFYMTYKKFRKIKGKRII